MWVRGARCLVPRCRWSLHGSTTQETVLAACAVGTRCLQGIPCGRRPAPCSVLYTECTALGCSPSLCELCGMYSENAGRHNQHCCKCPFSHWREGAQWIVLGACTVPAGSTPCAGHARSRLDGSGCLGAPGLRYKCNLYLLTTSAVVPAYFKTASKPVSSCQPKPSACDRPFTDLT